MDVSSEDAIGEGYDLESEQYGYGSDPRSSRDLAALHASSRLDRSPPGSPQGRHLRKSSSVGVSRPSAAGAFGGSADAWQAAAAATATAAAAGASGGVALLSLRARPPRTFGPLGEMDPFTWEAAVAQAILRAVTREEADMPAERCVSLASLVSPCMSPGARLQAEKGCHQLRLGLGGLLGRRYAGAVGWWAGG